MKLQYCPKGETLLQFIKDVHNSNQCGLYTFRTLTDFHPHVQHKGICWTLLFRRHTNAHLLTSIQ